MGSAGAQGYYGIAPDLTTLGKVIGGGMPVGAFGGKEDIMNFIAPVGPVYQAGTLSGNPIAMAAGLMTLKKLDQPNFYEKLFDSTNKLAAGLQTAANEAGIPFTTNSVGSMWGCFFTTAEKVKNYQQVMAGNIDAFNMFFHGMLKSGVYLAPACYEAGFLSIAHSEQDIDETVAHASEVFKTLPLKN